MTNLARRLRKLEKRLTDISGLVPLSQKWMDYWTERASKILGEPSVPISISGEYVDALLDRLGPDPGEGDWPDRENTRALQRRL